MHWEQIRYFTPEEFQDPDAPGSGELIASTLLLLLDKLRHETGWPIVTHWQVGGCIDVNGTHGHARHSYHREDRGCRAVDFHFKTTTSPGEQYYELSKQGFPGIGVYYDWHWGGKSLPIGFHVDTRPKAKTQRWVRNLNYFYLLRGTP